MAIFDEIQASIAGLAESAGSSRSGEPGTPTRRTPRVTLPAAPPSRPAGTARPATNWWITSRATPRCTTCNRPPIRCKRPLLNAWYDSSGNEIGDKCAWINLHEVTTSGGSFAVQPLWSNAASGRRGEQQGRAEALGHIRAYSRRQRSWFRKLGASRVGYRSAVKVIVSQL